MLPVAESKPRKLIIQIPCYNEAKTLPETVRDLPQTVHGYDVVEFLVIDDGSKDDTVLVAQSCGVHHIVSHSTNQGLARTFATGLKAAIKLGAHTVVNLDADNQYCADDIPLLVAPILDGRANVVIGTRPIGSITEFSRAKKILQYLGSLVVRKLSGTTVQDAPSGFRAIHHDIAKRIVIYSTFSYTIEMLVQLGYRRNVTILSVPIRVNPMTRPSRLARSSLDYMIRAGIDLMRVLVLFRPLMIFSIVSCALLVPPALIALRYIIFMFSGHGGGHIQSLLLALVFILASSICLAIGFVCDSIKTNRLLLEELHGAIAGMPNTPS